MNLSTVMYPIDTLYSFTTMHVSKTQKQYPKLIKFFNEPKKQDYIRFSEFEERMEIENDSTTKIIEGDDHYFPPSFQYTPPEKCKSKKMTHDSPWNNNFGNAEKMKKKAVQEEMGGRKKKSGKTKREKFMDVQIGILKCIVPPIGFLYDLEKEKQKRKRYQK